MNCEFCSSPAHVWFQCPKKPDGWKPARLAKTSTAARKDVQGLASLDTSSRIASEVANNEAGNLTGLGNGWETKSRNSGAAGIQALPVDTNSQAVESGVSAFGPHGVITSSAGTEGEVDRPKFNKNEYQCRYMREVYRPRLKAKKDSMK